MEGADLPVSRPRVLGWLPARANAWPATARCAHGVPSLPAGCFPSAREPLPSLCACLLCPVPTPIGLRAQPPPAPPLGPAGTWPTTSTTTRWES